MTAPAPPAEAPTLANGLQDTTVSSVRTYRYVAGLIFGQVVSGAAIGAVAIRFFGEAVIPYAVAAALVCVVGSIFGLLLSVRFTGPQSVIGMLLGLSVRMGVAMVAMVVAAGQQLFGTGFPECLVANYLISLVFDTLLAVRMLKQATRT